MVEVIHFINTFKCIINIHAKCLSKMNMSAYIHGYQTCSLLIWILSSFGIKKKNTFICKSKFNRVAKMYNN